MIKFITPNWPAPVQVKAYTTTRHGGYSQPPYEGFNLADHVGDDAKAVAANRALLKETLNLPAEPLWLKQVHSNQVVKAIDVQKNVWHKTFEVSKTSKVSNQNLNADNSHCIADATVATTPGQVCVVMTADCLPVFFCDRSGTRIAVAHAGWRGLAGGVLEACLQHFDLPPKDILAWFGPAIGPQAFEVGPEVRQAFIEFLPQATEAFKQTHEDRFLADLYCLARQRLAHQGVTAIYGGDFCTYTEIEHFYSYRRDKVTGRMASLIWLEG